MPYQCPYAYRRPNCNSLLCHKLDGAETLNGMRPFCGSQYNCRVTGRWENTNEAARCPILTRDLKKPGTVAEKPVVENPVEIAENRKPTAAESGKAKKQKAKTKK